MMRLGANKKRFRREESYDKPGGGQNYEGAGPAGPGGPGGSGPGGAAPGNLYPYKT